MKQMEDEDIAAPKAEVLPMRPWTTRAIRTISSGLLRNHRHVALSPLHRFMI